MFGTRLFKKLLFLSCFLVLFSCVKDVDLEQAQEIVIPPSAAIDLVYFELVADDFIDASGADKKATDKTRLEFLDDDYIQESLMNANFNFIFTNSFQRGFVSTITFLSEGNSPQYSFSIDIPAGTADDPTIVNYTQIVPETQIRAIRNSIWLQVEVEMLPGANPAEGNLKLESKAFYKFEFK